VAISATVNDVARDALAGSCSCSFRLGYPPSLSIAFLDPASAPLVGQGIGIYEDADRLFGGTIDEVVQRLYSGYSGNKILYEVRAAGWEQRLQKRLMHPASTTADPSTTFASWSGTCDTSGTALAWVSGDRFDLNFTGTKVTINGSTYTVASVASPTAATLATSAGTQSGVAWSWQMTAGNIVRSVIANFANGEGFTLQTVDDGETLEKEVFDHSWTVAAVLDRMAKSSNKIWYIEPDKDFYFTARNTRSAPVAITTSNTLREAWDCRTTREEVQNAHYRRISFGAVAQNEAVLAGDDTARTFYLDHPAHLVESGNLRLDDGVWDASIGNRDAPASDTGYDFYWALGEYAITQDTAVSKTVSGASNEEPIEITTTAAHGLKSGHLVLLASVGGNTAANGRFRIDVTATDKFTIRGSVGNGAYTSGGTVEANQTLTSTESLVLYYREMGGDIISAVDATDQSNRATTEGTSGKYEAFEDDSSSVDAVGAQEFANNIVGARTPDIIQAQFATETTLGLRVGQMADVTNSRYGLSSAQILIDEITLRDIDGQYFRQTVRGNDGVYLDGWREYFAALRNRKSGGGSVSIVSSSASAAGSGGGGAGSTTVEQHSLATSTTVISSPGVPGDGDQLIKVIDQDATGGRQITWASDFAGDTPVDISTIASTRSIFHFIGYGSKWRMVARQTERTTT